MAQRGFDVVVLGAGSGGYAAALRAAQLGKSVALVERDRVGGTCLHRGCIPTKALLHAAEVADTARDAASVGVRARLDGVDMPALLAWRDGVIAGKHKGLQSLLAARGVTTVHGEGTLTSDRRVRVGDDELVGGDVVLATGSYSRTLPGLSLGGRIIDSEQALALTEVPRRAVVLGGGVIGVEFASLWRSLGAEVTIVEALEHLVPAEDAVVGKGLERAFRKRGIAFTLGVRFASAAQTDDAVTVTLEDGTTIDADVLLVAVGRGPATAGLGFEEAGVVLEHGFVRTDAMLRTDAEHVWAVGDVVAGPQLAHRGFAHGIFVAEQIAGAPAALVPDAHIPRVTYSRPEVAAVGLSEQQAVAAYGADAVAAVQYSLAGNAKSEILGTSGFVKVVRRKDGPVLGVHMLGDRVGELVAEAQLVVGWDAYPEDVAGFLHAHPTQGEALGEAFLALAGKPLHSL